jgi:cytochrome P450 family 6
VVLEILRKYPPAHRLERRCVKEYKIPESDVIIPVGQIVAVPVQGIHHDEQYWPEPERFHPERFSAENKNSRNPYTYLPFGMGPRNCIGLYTII